MLSKGTVDLYDIVTCSQPLLDCMLTTCKIDPEKREGLFRPKFGLKLGGAGVCPHQDLP